jgi:HAD superfamily hydrolase (TIGR01490 family)
VTRAAFFDVDNTLVKGSSLFLIGRGMLRHGVIRRRDVLRFAVVQVMFRLRGERLGHVHDAQDRALSLGTGLVVEDVVALGHEIYEQRVAGRLWVETVDLTRAHLAAGCEVWLVSAAPVELVQIMARALGLTGGLGTVAEVEDGRWTGRLAAPFLHGAAKAAAVRDLAERRGLALQHCDAYSDSIHDRELLEAVGHPHAVNPDRQLHRLAVERDWPVHRHARDRRATAGRAATLVRVLRLRPAR